MYLNFTFIRLNNLHYEHLCEILPYTVVLKNRIFPVTSEVLKCYFEIQYKASMIFDFQKLVRYYCDHLSENYHLHKQI